jgi:aerobic C4-dicarboxylate transport protein
LLRYIKEELLIVRGLPHRSGFAIHHGQARKIGLQPIGSGTRDSHGLFVQPDGTSIYLSMAVIFLAQLYDVDLSWFEMASIIGILMITSKGAAGVTGSGFIVLASTLTIHKIPVEGLAFLLGVDKFMSEARAITNLIGNSVATIVIAKRE